MDCLLLMSVALHSFEPSVTVYHYTRRHIQEDLNLQCLVSHGKFLRSLFDVIATTVPGPPHWRRFTIALRHLTLDRTSLTERSARRRPARDNKQHSQRTGIHVPMGFEPKIPGSEGRIPSS
jgi:hypothetical protein